jgi:hypothetical protein
VADRLDRVDLLHQRPSAADHGRPPRVGERDQEEEAVGHQPGEHRRDLHDAEQREPFQRGLGQDRPAHQHDQRHHQPHHEVDPPLQRGLVGRHPACLGGEPARVARRAHVAGFLVALPGHAEGPGAQVVARLLHHRLGFPGEQGLVGLDPAAREQRSVHDDLVARPHPHDVAAHDLGGRYRHVGAAADHDHLCRVEQLQPVELPLRPDLLRRADHGVDQAQPHADERIVVAAHREQRGADDEQDRVVEGEDVGAQDRRVAA